MKAIVFGLLVCAFEVPLAAVTWPIGASSDGGYFVDHDNVPWLMVGDSGHHLISVLPMPEWDAYLSDRAAKGFNLVDVFATCARGNCPRSGAAQDGTAPFTVGSGPTTYDLSAPNGAEGCKPCAWPIRRPGSLASNTNAWAVRIEAGFRAQARHFIPQLLSDPQQQAAGVFLNHGIVGLDEAAPPLAFQPRLVLNDLSDYREFPEQGWIAFAHDSSTVCHVG